MRGKQQGAHLVEDEEDEEEDEAEDFLGNMKPRVGSPLDGGCGGGFWMAAVSAAAGGTMESPGLLGGPQAETGFISSQPSMAEFILPHHLEMGGGDPLSPQQGYPPGLVDQGVNVQEYPWMKEKKTTRKSSQQGKPALTLLKIIFIPFIIDVKTPTCLYLYSTKY